MEERRTRQSVITKLDTLARQFTSTFRFYSIQTKPISQLQNFACTLHRDNKVQPLSGTPNQHPKVSLRYCVFNLSTPNQLTITQFERWIKTERSKPLNSSKYQHNLQKRVNISDEWSFILKLCYPRRVKKSAVGNTYWPINKYICKSFARIYRCIGTAVERRF